MKKVLYARLQTPMHLPGVGDLGAVFPPNGPKTLNDLEMETDGLYLHIKFSWRGIKKELMVPGGNVVLMDIVPEIKVK